MKIIIIGFGSIGKRHYKNLKTSGCKDVSVFDIGDDVPWSDADIAFICSPNHLHIKHATKAAKAGCHVFIEKPLSHTLRGVDELSTICKQKKLVNMVGCNMRFHPCVRFIKKYLEQKKLGKVHAIHHEFGYFLPSWRKGQDYRKNYAAKRSSGGGVILDDIHEFDMLFWLNDFLPVTQSQFLSGTVSRLLIETEDICVASLMFKNKVVGTVRCDYLQQRYSRNCKIVGETGNLFWDWNDNIVWLEKKNSRKKLFERMNYNLNDMYLEEIEYFMECVEKRKQTFNDVVRSKGILELVVKNV